MTGFLLWRTDPSAKIVPSPKLSRKDTANKDEQEENAEGSDKKEGEEEEEEEVVVKPTKKKDHDTTVLKLPSGIRNISTKMNKSNSCVLSSGHVYAVAGIRKELYIWSMETEQLVLCL